ncbi:MAG TPA: LysR family transcriptional regulator [Dehalococcoidia bacterium]|nr:LysR family transcriptional regulator [Dehalococcoidia bacterium]
MNLASVDLNLLVALDAILDERHVTRAGERLGLTQPTMSHTLGRLRRLFDDQLLIRIGRGYELTPLARDLRQPVRDILKQIEQTIEYRPSFDPAVDEHVFTITASDYATYVVFQPALRRMQEVAPGVRLEIHPLWTGWIPAVEAGDVDLAIVPSAIGPDLPSEELFADKWVAVAWSGNEELDGTLSMEQYLSFPHLAYGSSLQGLEGVGILDRAILATHPEARVAVLMQSFFMLPFMLPGTRYIAVVHERMALQVARQGDFKILQLEFPTARITEAMFWHPRLTSDTAHRWLRTFLRESTGTIDC